MDIHAFDKFVKVICGYLPADWICSVNKNVRTFHNTQYGTHIYIASLTLLNDGRWQIAANPELFDGLFCKYPFYDGREIKMINCPEIDACIRFLEMLRENVIDSPR